MALEEAIQPILTSHIKFVVEIVFDIIPLSVLVRKKLDPFGGETKHELTAFDNVVLQLFLLRRYNIRWFV